jgi:FkbM family methyltransferase
MTSADAKLSLGQQQAHSGDYRAASETFQAILREEPGNLAARLSLAHISSYLGRYGEAEKILTDLIESEPERLEIRVALGQLYAHLGRRSDAIARFREVIEIDPADGDAWAGIINLASNPGPASADNGTARASEGSDTPDPEDERRKAYRERRRLFLVDRLHPLLDDGEKFVLLDGGARDVSDDPRWRGLPDNKIKVYAFEPDEAECERLTREAKDTDRDVQFFPVGLWGHKGTLSFECNKTGGGSSFLHQNRRVTDRWKFENPQDAVRASDIFFPVQESPIAVASLESWSRENNVPGVDFIKLNVQGGELEILRGAGALLDGSLGLLVEVAFVESYENRPFFSDIDPFLRDRGFSFFDLLAHHYVGRASAPIVAQHLRSAKPALGQLISSWGQLIEGHALYLRDPIAGPGQDPPGRIIKLICIAEIFGQVEYAFELLGWLTARCRDRSQNVLAEQLDSIMAEAAAHYRRIM